MGNFAENLNLGNRFRPPPPNLYLYTFSLCILLTVWVVGIGKPPEIYIQINDN